METPSASVNEAVPSPEPEADPVAHWRAKVVAASVRARTLVVEHGEPPRVPPTAELFGEATELTKRGLQLIGETRALLEEYLDRLKQAHTDNLRGSKASLSDADKSKLRGALDADDAYVHGLLLVEQLKRIAGHWDARRSRLNREYEVALTIYRQGVAMAIIESERARLGPRRD